MALAVDPPQPFSAWLETHFKSLNADVDSCLVDYIVGMLETEEDEESLVEGLSEILEEIASDEKEPTIRLIVAQWKEHRAIGELETSASTASSSAFDSVLASALEKQAAVEAKPQRRLTKDDKERLEVKEAILNLAAASAAEDGAHGDDGNVGLTADSVDGESAAPSLGPANLNVQKVFEEKREKREQSQKQAEAKKLKDKEDREKQKNQKLDKAEAEKKRTQKGERRR